ncbi:MAG: dihydropteroate synthase [Muribaculaceae bacterium]|nr:dihydropteroate synthase [Muribaculaceae bacterium]MDY6294546.1 dihydropteroate synthase [Bacteroidales bacterium]MDY6411930.1 dihydropteroate synthase [Bacteroidales bacterium]
MNDFKKYSLNLRGRLVEIDKPLVMGIINATPDSFYSDSRMLDAHDIACKANEMAQQGADIIDLGACSTRPGAQVVDASEEIMRLNVAVKAVRQAVGDEILLSVDTFRASVARHCVEELGVDIINDISGGDLDQLMHSTVAQLQVPYVVMHMRGTPATMQQFTNYDGDVAAVVLEELARKVDALHQCGINDVIADPGFGFAKTVEQNYRIMSQLEVFHALDVPLLVGISRKSMIQRVLNCDAAHALNGTTALNTIALMKGAHILRVHDVRAAVEARTLVTYTNNK